MDATGGEEVAEADPTQDGELLIALNHADPFAEYETGADDAIAADAQDVRDAGVEALDGQEDEEDASVVEDTGAAWRYTTKAPRVATNITAGRYGDRPAAEYVALCAKFCARFRVGKCSEITMAMLRDELDPCTGVIGQTLLVLLRGDGTLIKEENAVLVYWSFMRRRLRLMAHKVPSSRTKHPVMGAIYRPIIDGRGDVADLTHDEYLWLVKNFDNT